VLLLEEVSQSGGNSLTRREKGVKNIWAWVLENFLSIGRLYRPKIWRVSPIGFGGKDPLFWGISRLVDSIFLRLKQANEALEKKHWYQTLFVVMSARQFKDKAKEFFKQSVVSTNFDWSYYYTHIVYSTPLMMPRKGWFKKSLRHGRVLVTPRGSPQTATTILMRILGAKTENKWRWRW
jgi:hypothetical protein